jgi:hypothetical protein
MRKYSVPFFLRRLSSQGPNIATPIPQAYRWHMSPARSFALLFHTEGFFCASLGRGNRKFIPILQVDIKDQDHEQRQQEELV